MYTAIVFHNHIQGTAAPCSHFRNKNTVFIAGHTNDQCNAHAKHPSPKHQNPGDYAESTGFEALLGFLYLTEQEARLLEIRDLILEGEHA